MSGEPDVYKRQLSESVQDSKVIISTCRYRKCREALYFKAVSYTHLDVYKRQIYKRCKRNKKIYHNNSIQ